MNDLYKKDINKRTELPATQEAVSGVGGNNYLSFISNKSQKIVAALYLVTGNLPETEPLKHNIRQKSLELMEVTHKMGADSVFAKKDKILLGLEHLKSLVSIGESAGYISILNSEILKREIGKLEIYLNDPPAQTDRKENIFPDNFFTVEEKYEDAPLARREAREEERENVPEMKNIKDNVEKQKNIRNNHVPNLSLKPRKKNRREFILNVIAKKKEVTIKDISSVFHGCSEKTIQRELTSLVQEGLVLKEGERRWSTYRVP